MNDRRIFLLLLRKILYDLLLERKKLKLRKKNNHSYDGKRANDKEKYILE